MKRVAGCNVIVSPCGPSNLVADVQWKQTIAFFAVSMTGSLMKPGSPNA
jgi:hypothetical protein